MKEARAGTRIAQLNSLALLEVEPESPIRTPLLQGHFPVCPISGLEGQPEMLERLTRR
jgi:hypothetical protein